MGYAKTMMKGSIWSGLQIVSDRGVVAILTLVLARWLGPTELGAATLAMTPAVITNVALGGFSDVIVRAEDDSVHLLSAAFWTSLFVAVVVVFLLLSAALVFPTEGAGKRIVVMLCTATLTCPLAALSSVPNAILLRSFQFRALFLRKLVGNTMGAVAAIGAAYFDWKAWSLVVFLLVSQSVGTVIVMFFAKWTPKWHVRISEAKSVISFSGSVFLSNLIYQISSRSFEVTTGLLIGLEAAGYVKLSLQFIETISLLLFYPVSLTLYVVVSKFQGSRDRIRGAFIDLYQFALVVGGLLYGGIIVMAESLITTILGAHWDNSIIICQVVGFVFLFYSFDSPARECIKAVGNAKRYLLLAVIASITSILMVSLGAAFGVKIAAVFYVLASVVNATTCYVIIKPLLGLRISMFLGYFMQEIAAFAPSVWIGLWIMKFSIHTGKAMVLSGLFAGAGFTCIYLLITLMLKRSFLTAQILRLAGRE
jgi:O-antigen/teichoic acid export membrane protein